MKKKKQSIFCKILEENSWLASKISEKEKISTNAISSVKNTGKWKVDLKFQLYMFMVENNYIRVGQYTQTEFFRIWKI